jgi:hypothetical protein
VCHCIVRIVALPLAQAYIGGSVPCLSLHAGSCPVEHAKTGVQRTDLTRRNPTVSQVGEWKLDLMLMDSCQYAIVTQLKDWHVTTNNLIYDVSVQLTDSIRPEPIDGRCVRKRWIRSFESSRVVYDRLATRFRPITM